MHLRFYENFTKKKLKYCSLSFFILLITIYKYNLFLQQLQRMQLILEILTMNGNLQKHRKNLKVSSANLHSTRLALLTMLPRKFVPNQILNYTAVLNLKHKNLFNCFMKIVLIILLKYFQEEELI